MKPLEVPDQTGKIAIITGYKGLAYHSAKALLEANAEVIILARSIEKAKENVEKLKSETHNDKISVEYMDLCKFETIHAFAKSYIESKRPLHILMNNAGVLAIPERQVTEDGNEVQFQTNYLGHFLLTHLLLPVLKTSAPSRIVCLSSMVHGMPQASIHLDDMNLEHRYTPFRGYCQSKLACLLFAYELSRRLKDTNITVNAVHPGIVYTDIWNPYIPNIAIGRFVFKLFVKFFALTPEQGARTQIYVATSKECETETGHYYSSCKKSSSWGLLSRKKAFRKELYEKTLEMVGLEKGVEEPEALQEIKNE